MKTEIVAFVVHLVLLLALQNCENRSMYCSLNSLLKARILVYAMWMLPKRIN